MSTPYDSITSVLNVLNATRILTESPTAQISAITSASQLNPAVSPIAAVSKLKDAMESVIPATLPGLCQALTSYSDVSSLYRSNLDSLSPISKTIKETIQPMLSDIAPASNRLEEQSIVDCLKLLSSAVPSIKVHSDYVEIPECLINLEADDNIELSKDSLSVSHRITLANAVPIIYHLAILLMTAATLYYARMSYKQTQQDQQENLVMRQEDHAMDQAQLDAANKTNEYLLEIINLLSDNHESAQATDLFSPDNPLVPAASDSNACLYHESNPTSDAAPDNSGYSQKSE